MPGLGLIEPARLRLMPRRCQARHEFCFHLHDIMVSVVRESETHRVADVTMEFPGNDEAPNAAQIDDPISFLLNRGQTGVAKRVVLNHLCLALYADLLHFLYEALIALEKRKFTVAFTLLRKPLKESMMFATWMFADDEDFFDRMLRSPADHMEGKDLPKTRRLELLQTAIARFEIASVFDAQLIHDIVFDRNMDDGLAQLFDKATHLVTSRGPMMRTEEINLNFIFKNPMEDDLYDIVYPRLSYVLLYIVLLQIELYSQMRSVEKTFGDWVLITSLGAYHGLFGTGSSPLLKSCNRIFAELLICPHCRATVRIKKTAAARFFVTERLDCDRCGNEHQFPLFWLMSKGEWTIADSTRENERQIAG